MASSSVQENAHDAPAAPRITPPRNSTQPTLTNLKLNHEWMIGEPIPKENQRHAMVYSILISETGQSAEDLEAHVFALDDIEPKLRKHRQRCIKRMEGRTKLKLHVDKFNIVVITTTRTENIGVLEPGPEPHSSNDDGQHETDSGHVSVGKVRKKTPYQREVQRIRQKEEQKAKRRAKTRQGGQMTTDDEKDITRNIDQDLFDSIDWENELPKFLNRITTEKNYYGLFVLSKFLY